MLIDGHGRIIDYVRLAVTDRCNLRCFYCMPEEGIDFVQRKELLSYEEIIRVVRLLSEEGVSKVRITGGEPFLRKDIMSLLRSISELPLIAKIAITTNGTLTEKHLDELVVLGIDSFNLSIDSIDAQRFQEITRRDSFETVWSCYKVMLAKGLELKLNCVVMANRNIADLIPMVELGRKAKVSIRFIEEMPFNGEGSHYQRLEWDYAKILSHLTEHFGEVEKLQDPQGSTSINYRVPDFQGSFGIIPAYTRSFCGSCNRLRLTPDGTIKTCLYDDGVFNIKNIIRAGATDDELMLAIKEAIAHKAKDGFIAEQSRNGKGFVSESMATIGG